MSMSGVYGSGPLPITAHSNRCDKHDPFKFILFCRLPAKSGAVLVAVSTGAVLVAAVSLAAVHRSRKSDGKPPPAPLRGGCVQT